MGELRDLREHKQVGRELPPVDARLWNPDFQGKFQTPVNELGIVDLDELVMLGTVTIDASFDWTSRGDVHHTQWPRSRYADDKLAVEFREMSSRKVILPRTFHNWLHKLTLPPELPTREVMHYTIEAEKTTRALAEAARLAVRLTRIKGIDDRALEERLEQQLDTYIQHAEAAKMAPPEFQTLLRPADLTVKTVEGLIVRNRKLGERAVSHIPVRRRLTRNAA